MYSDIVDGYLIQIEYFSPLFHLSIFDCNGMCVCENVFGTLDGAKCFVYNYSYSPKEVAV